MSESTKPHPPSHPSQLGVRFPEITITLVGVDGNAFSIIKRVRKAMRKAQVGDVAILTFQAQATSGDYDHLLETVRKYVNVE